MIIQVDDFLMVLVGGVAFYDCLGIILHCMVVLMVCGVAVVIAM